MVKSSKKSKNKEPLVRNAKEERLFSNLLKITEQFMGGKSFQPLSKEELMQRLSLPPQHEEIFQQVLDQLLHNTSLNASPIAIHGSHHKMMS